MNWKFSLAAMVALTVFVGCLPSLNPVYKEDQLVFDPKMVGVWEPPDSSSRWKFTKRDDTSYHLLFTDNDGRQGQFVAHLAEINGTRFLDLFPEDTDQDVSGFYKVHLVPIHTVYLVKGTAPNLELAAINYEWLDKQLAAHPDAIEYSEFNGRKLITASTDDLQAFVLKHQDMFTGDFQLERQTKN